MAEAKNKQLNPNSRAKVEVQINTDKLKPHKKGDKVVMYKTTANALGKNVEILREVKPKEHVKNRE